jgi:hypothetical protein
MVGGGWTDVEFWVLNFEWSRKSGEEEIADWRLLILDF